MKNFFNKNIRAIQPFITSSTAMDTLFQLVQLLFNVKSPYITH